MEQHDNSVRRDNLILLHERRKDLKNGDNLALEDLNRLDRIYSEIQKLNSSKAKKAAAIGCRTAQALIAKGILD